MTEQTGAFARAVEAARFALVDESGGFGEDDDLLISAAIVRAVLGAIREPDALVGHILGRYVYKDEIDSEDEESLCEGWTKVIDAILAEQPK